MAILVDRKTRVICQGITGQAGTYHAASMIAYGTKVVGGVTPGKGGQKAEFDGASLPVFNSVGEAMAETGADVTVIFVPPKFAKGAMLEAVTLGIYRFWLYTDMRRFLWATTRVAGDTPDYTGTAAELLIGFLVALGILVPIYAALFGLALSLDLQLPSQVSAIIAFLVLAVFGQYAGYRARRYRLTRTVFRGLRFHQDGSGWLYALYAILWWILIVVSLGLAYPWAQANLQRYMMRHTSYGKLPGRFEGSGWRLFLRGLPLWLAQTNCWLVAPSGPGGEAVIIDAPPDPDAIVGRLRHHDLRLVAIFSTHGHIDHKPNLRPSGRGLC